MKLMDIETPAALIDERRMAGNIARMQDHLTSLGVRLRPHVKTSKCVEVARAQRQGPRGDGSACVVALRGVGSGGGSGNGALAVAIAMAVATTVATAAAAARYRWQLEPSTRQQ